MKFNVCVFIDLLLFLQEWQWQFGVLGVLVVWLSLSITLNKIPKFTAFMPFNHNFIFTYAKVILHIVLIILAFAMTFHFLLLDSSSAFENFPSSLIKTLVWMLGDLAYDDTFLDDDSKLLYPVQTNLIFVFFIVFIGGYLFNLIIRESNDDIENIKRESGFYQAEASLNLHLLIDDCVPKLRRRHAVNKKTIVKQDAASTSVFYSQLNIKRKSMDPVIQCKHKDTCGSKGGPGRAGVEDGGNGSYTDTADLRDLVVELMAKIDKQRDEIGDLSRRVTNLRR